MPRLVRMRALLLSRSVSDILPSRRYFQGPHLCTSTLPSLLYRIRCFVLSCQSMSLGLVSTLSTSQACSPPLPYCIILCAYYTHTIQAFPGKELELLTPPVRVHPENDPYASRPSTTSGAHCLM